MLPTSTNGGQPAFALYSRHGGGDHLPFQIHVLTLAGGRVARVCAFFGRGLFRTFGLPDAIPADGRRV